MLEKIKYLLIVIFLSVPSTAIAWEDWDSKTRDSFLRTTNWITLDWHSTNLSAADGWNGVRELNPILGPYPTQEEIALYFVARVGLNYWMHDKGWSKTASLLSIGHVAAAVNNYNINGNSDKIAHIIAGSAISEIVYYNTGNRWKGCAAALGAGVLKEIIDNRFDSEDAIATGLGCSILRIEF